MRVKRNYTSIKPDYSFTFLSHLNIILIYFVYNCSFFFFLSVLLLPIFSVNFPEIVIQTNNLKFGYSNMHILYTK